MNKKAEMTAEEKKEMDFAARVKAAMEQAQATPDFKFGTDDDDDDETRKARKAKRLTRRPRLSPTPRRSPSRSPRTR